MTAVSDESGIPTPPVSPDRSHNTPDASVDAVFAADDTTQHDDDYDDDNQAESLNKKSVNEATDENHDRECQAQRKWTAEKVQVTVPVPSSRGNEVGSSRGLELIPEDEPCSVLMPNEDEFVDPNELAFHKVIGVGGQAKVFLATWTRSFGFSSSSVTVAVKKMKPTVKNIDREALALRVFHPNLVQSYGASVNVPPYLIVMEYCRGGSLYDHIYHPQSFSFTWEQRMKIASDVADGMAYLHSHTPKITHRDLKSTNILLVARIKDADEEPEVKITDFGLARAQGHRGSWGAMTQCVGTWRWMAPEVFSSTKYDEKADVFSFAMVMYEVITFKVPYSDNWPDVKTMLNPRIGLHVVQGLRPALERVPVGCPPNLVDLTRRCWKAEAENRPNFEEIAQELQNQRKLMQLYKMVKGPKQASNDAPASPEWAQQVKPQFMPGGYPGQS